MSCYYQTKRDMLILKCDVCGKEFKTKQVRTGKARFIGTDDILKLSTEFRR